MTAGSYSLSYGQEDQPADIALGVAAPGAGDVELRFTTGLQPIGGTKDIILILQAFIRRLEDGRYGPADTLNI